MMKELQWYNIAIRLRDFLKSFKYNDGRRLFDCMVDRQDRKIRVGQGNTGEYPAIYILFGDESDVEKQDNRTGARVQLWVDVYVKGEATPDIDYDDCLYKQMFEVEQEFIKVLRIFNKDLHRRGIATNLVIQAILSDGDENAPVTAQNRIVIDIEWYK